MDLNWFDDLSIVWFDLMIWFPYFIYSLDLMIWWLSYESEGFNWAWIHCQKIDIPNFNKLSQVKKSSYKLSLKNIKSSFSFSIATAITRDDNIIINTIHLLPYIEIIVYIYHRIRVRFRIRIRIGIRSWIRIGFRSWICAGFRIGIRFRTIFVSAVKTTTEKIRELKKFFFCNSTENNWKLF